MMKILSALVAVALAGPGVRTFADDSAAAGAKEAGAEAKEAGAEAKEAGEKAEQAGGKAQRSADARRQKHAGMDESAVKRAGTAIEELKRADADLTRLFDGAAGYAVFATVGKGAAGVGGAHGTGVLYEKGKAVGNATLTQLTVGVQLGGQAYTEVIFFENGKSLAHFKKGQFTMAAQVSAVVAAAGASANAKYVEGVSVFTLAKGGVMAEASVGGQKFSYGPFKKAIVTSSR